MGGNTTCLEFREGRERIIIDAGTGIRGLGEQLTAEARARGEQVKAQLFFTHLHWDHIQGFPFFAPAYFPGTELKLYGPSDLPGKGSELPESAGKTQLEVTLDKQMRPPSFPVPLAAMASQRQYTDLEDQDRLQLGPFEILTRRLDHPQGCLGYRIEAGGRSVCFATDTEHAEDGQPSDALRELAEGVDLMIYDAQFTPDEYEGRGPGPSRRGWGHSTHEIAARFAAACGARALALFHHDPGHDDRFVERMERDARSIFPWSGAAREGVSLNLG